MEEKELAIRCSKGDKAAQRELYEEYGSRILALCRRYAADKSEAEDLMQDAFIKIFKVIGHFRWTRPGSLYSWMARVTINMAFDSSKKRRTLVKQLVDIDQLEDMPEDNEYEESAPIPADVLDDMIEALPEGYRTVFKLYCIDGLSHKEIADLLRIKEKSSSASLSRARALLSEAIRQYWRETEDGASPEGWSHILRKMRQRATFRNAMLVFSFLIPAAALSLWNLSRPDDLTATYASHIIGNTPSLTIDNQLKQPERLMLRSSAVQADTETVTDHEYLIPHDDRPVRNEDETNPGKADIIPSVAKETTDSSDKVDEMFPTIQKERRRSRPRFSLSIKGGSGAIRRNTDIYLESSPYIAALTFMNTVDPDMIPDSKSNYSNAIPWYTANYIEPTAPPETKSGIQNAADFTPASTNIYRHGLPVTFGLSARMDMNSRIGAESGIEYTYMHSTVETVVGKLDQNLHFIGIPLRFDFQVFSWKGVDMYIGIGGKAEKCIAASLGQVRCEEKQLQWSADAFAGIQYKVGRRAHLYLQPEFSYCFTNTDLITYRTDNPCIFSLNAGLRFDL